MNRKKVIFTALKEFGQKEIKGSTHNPRVIEYFKKVGHSWVTNDETAWCAAFVGYCLEVNEIPSTRKLNARSYLDFGFKTTNPTIGDIAVFSRGSNPVYGHVALYIGEVDGYYLVLGGNQGDEVKISKYSKSRLLEFRTY